MILNRIMKSSMKEAILISIAQEILFQIYLASGKLQVKGLAFCPTTLLGGAYSRYLFG